MYLYINIYIKLLTVVLEIFIKKYGISDVKVFLMVLDP